MMGDSSTYSVREQIWQVLAARLYLYLSICIDLNLQLDLLSSLLIP